MNRIVFCVLTMFITVIPWFTFAGGGGGGGGGGSSVPSLHIALQALIIVFIATIYHRKK